MAYPLTGATQTATGGTVIRTPAVDDMPSSVVRTALSLSQAGSLLTTTRGGAVTVAQAPQPPATGQMWPRGGRTNTG